MEAAGGVAADSTTAASASRPPSSSSSSTGSTVPATSSSAAVMDVTKYKTLAAEYSKMRGQLAVLKKAVIDEQAKNVELQDTLREREVKLRKSEAEMDSIVFRNQQLTRRVEILQEEQHVVKPASSSAKKKGNDAAVAASESLNSVMGEELQLKIAENAKLHAALDGVDAKHAEEISGLQSKISELESRVTKRAQADRSEDTRLKDMLQGLKITNSDLTHRVTELEKEVVDKNDRITVLQVQLESTSSSCPPSASSPSLQPDPDQMAVVGHAQTAELLSQLGENVQDVVAALSDLHTYWQHRLKDTASVVGGVDKKEVWTDSNRRLSDLLLQNVKHLKPIEASYQDALSDLLSGNKFTGGRHLLTSGLAGFSSALAAYVKYAVDDVEPLVVVSIQQESNSSSSSPTQQSTNGQLQSEIRAFNRVLERLSEHIETLVTIRPEADTIENISVAVCQLCQQARDLLRVYRSKAGHESELPTVSSQLKNTNKCVVNALSCLVGSLESLSVNLSDALPFAPAMVGANFDTTSTQSPPPVVASSESHQQEEKLEEVNREQDTDLLSDKVARLEQEISDLNERLKTSEQAKEHWKLECQLIQMKHDKLKKAGDEIAEEEETSDGDKQMALMFKARIDGLVAEKLAADSKATHFYLECAGLLRQTRARERDKARALARLSEAQAKVDALRGDVDSTSTNYESQLAVMTEHVAAMNERLAQQTDEIDRLKFQLKRGKKK